MTIKSKLRNIIKIFKNNYNLKKLNLKKISLAEIISSVNIKLLETVDSSGGLTLEELGAIISIAKYFNCKNYLEIGAFKGRTTINIAANNNNIEIHTIDLPINYNENNLEYNLLPKDSKLSQYKEKGYFFKKYIDYKKNIFNHYGDSATFDYKIFQKKFDLIFIDASHKYENVIIDSENALKILSKNGIIIWHDYSLENLEVVNAIKYIKNKNKINILSIKNTKFAFYNSNIN